MGLSCTKQTNRENRCCSLILEWELLLSLCRVLCAAEVFVVTQASDKASCSSRAKSRTSPQGPQVGVGSPAAPCGCFIIWKHTGRETDGERETHTHWSFIFPYIDLQALCWTQLWDFTNCLRIQQVWGEQKNGTLAHEYFSHSCVSNMFICVVWWRVVTSLSGRMRDASTYGHPHHTSLLCAAANWWVVCFWFLLYFGWGGRQSIHQMHVHLWWGDCFFCYHHPPISFPPALEEIGANPKTSPGNRLLVLSPCDYCL